MAQVDLERIGSGRAAREDYALQKVPPTWRYRGSAIVLSLMGGATAGIFLAFPAELAGSFGIANVLVGMAYALVVQTLLNYVFVRAAARTGLSSDLMSRGLALGFDGSAWTTLIYWVSWVTYFGTEGQILAGAVSKQFDISLHWSYIIVGLAFLPLVLYGLGFMAKFQKWTLYLYVIAMVALVWKVLSGPNIGGVTHFWGEHSSGLTGLGALGALAAYNGLIGNVTFGHADMGRLLAVNADRPGGARRSAWAISLLPYSFFAYVVFGLLGLLFWASTSNTNPGEYFVQILGVAGFLLIILTQLRINLINAYSGSLSLANFFSRLHWIPGRAFWAVLMVAIGTAAMYADILGNLGTILTFEGVFLAAWVGVISSDLLVVRGRGKHGPRDGQFIEYRRSMLRHWNPVGVTALAVSTAVGMLFAFGGQNGLFGGTVALDLSSWIAFAVAFVATWILGMRDRGRSYAIRSVIEWPRDDTVVECPLNDEIVATEDLFPCPHHGQWICSEDCMGTRGCGERCKSMTDEQLLLQIELPPRTTRLIEVNRKLAEAPDGAAIEPVDVAEGDLPRPRSV